MTETFAEGTPTVEEGRSMELVRIPVWEAKYTVGHDPDELAQMACCRDLDWQKAMCGYWDEMSRDLRPVHTGHLQSSWRALLRLECLAVNAALGRQSQSIDAEPFIADGVAGTRQGGIVGAHFTTRQALALSPGNGRHSLRSLDRDVARFSQPASPCRRFPGRP
jgi:hypothetical protein